MDTNKFINTAQVGGIEAYTIDEGPARGVRALCVNTGGGLRYRVLVDRGLDIDQAFFNASSLTFLGHKGVTPPTRGLDRGLDWLKGFPVGLLTSCGPFNVGPPVVDEGEELGLHGTHSNSGATIESVAQPRFDPPLREYAQKRLEMRIVGSVKYGALYGPCVELRRTITSALGDNRIEFVDEFFNAGNTDVPHAWLLHINMGWPLLDEGAEFCWNASKVEPLDAPLAKKVFGRNEGKKIPGPSAAFQGSESAVAHLLPKADRAGRAVVGVVNRKLGIGVAIRYNTKQFPRCGNWQHWGPREYVGALEPMNGTVNGRDKDRAAGLLDTLRAGGRKRYEYAIEVVTEFDELLRLNR